MIFFPIRESVSIIEFFDEFSPESIIIKVQYSPPAQKILIFWGHKK